jgi:DNA (cytosine-5)-methyltransferase 1
LGAVALDLFAGVGGLGLGFKAVGFEVIGFEIDRKKARTYSQNVGCCVVSDVRAASFRKCRVEVVAAGPPCRPYSTATPPWRKGPLHPEYGLDMEVARVAREASPKVVVVEEVPSWDPRPLARALERLGFEVGFQLVDFSKYGVPIARKRWLLLALNSASPGEVFEELGRAAELPPEPIELMNLPEELGGFPDHRSPCVRSKLKELIPFIPPGYSLSAAYRKGLVPKQLVESCVKSPSNKHSYWLYRVPDSGLVKVVPSPRRSLMLHPVYNRVLSVRELARLMTFPDSFNFSPLSVDGAMRAIGEAVPPRFSAKLAAAIVRTCAANLF